MLAIKCACKPLIDFLLYSFSVPIYRQYFCKPFSFYIKHEFPGKVKKKKKI